MEGDSIRPSEVAKMAQNPKEKVLSTDFCLQIAKTIGLENVKEGLNFVLSPISIHICISMVAAGSAGKTLNELLYFLKSKTIDDLNELSSRIVTLMAPDGKGGPAISFANSAWVDRRFTLKPDFREIISTTYGGEAKEIDFHSEGAAKEVNSWVDSKTNGVIKEVLQPGSVDKRTMLILANALYFKGDWSRPFEAANTKDRSFHLQNGKTIQVPFMIRGASTYFFRKFDDFNVLGLPYKNGQFSMFFFLPHEKMGLKNLIAKLNFDVGFFNQDFELKEEHLKVCMIPKFKMSCDFEASKTVRELGLVLPFVDTGTISEMVYSYDKLYLNEIFHKSHIEVNEKGTEAAAVTWMRLVGCARPPDDIESFVADHPFMFIVREETSRMVLFIGAVLNPSSAGI